MLTDHVYNNLCGIFPNISINSADTSVSGYFRTLCSGQVISDISGYSQIFLTQSTKFIRDMLRYIHSSSYHEVQCVPIDTVVEVQIEVT